MKTNNGLFLTCSNYWHNYPIFAGDVCQALRWVMPEVVLPGFCCTLDWDRWDWVWDGLFCHWWSYPAARLSGRVTSCLYAQSLSAIFCIDKLPIASLFTFANGPYSCIHHLQNTLYQFNFVSIVCDFQLFWYHHETRISERMDCFQSFSAPLKRIIAKLKACKHPGEYSG